MIEQLCRCAAAGGIVSIMTETHTNGGTTAMEQRWQDAFAAFDQRTGIGVLGVRGRADTVEEVSGLIERQGVEPMCWYGVWLFVDWLEFSGAELDPTDIEQVAATAAVELEASRRDPYRGLSRGSIFWGRRVRADASEAGAVRLNAIFPTCRSATLRSGVRGHIRLEGCQSLVRSWFQFRPGVHVPRRDSSADPAAPRSTAKISSQY